MGSPTAPPRSSGRGPSARERATACEEGSPPGFFAADSASPWRLDRAAHSLAHEHSRFLHRQFASSPRPPPRRSPRRGEDRLSALDRLPCPTGPSLTAMTPTVEGKTTTAISLVEVLIWTSTPPVPARALARARTWLAGGGTGGGRAQVAHGADQPPLHGRHPRDRRRQPARGDDRRPLMHGNARHRPALDHLAALYRHGRPHAAAGRSGSARR